MTIGGWIMLILSVGGMTGLLAWCVERIVSRPDTTKHMHSQANIEPDDKE